MRRIAFAILLATVAAFPQGKKDQPDWSPLRFFVGQWTGTAAGQAGKGKVERSYAFGLGGTFLIAKNRSIYPPQEVNPRGEIHEDQAFIGFDKARQKYVMRQFHVEGFVNQYVLDEITPDGKKLVFTTEAIENIAPGWRARETYLIMNRNEFREIFELAAPGKEFELYTQNDFHRSK